MQKMSPGRCRLWDARSNGVASAGDTVVDCCRQFGAPFDLAGAAMCSRLASIVTCSILCFALVMGASARAQTIHMSVSDIALKNGENIEFGDVYFIAANCSSLLTATPEVEIVDGPPGVAVTVKRAMVVPRFYGCAKPVAGGKIMIAAKDVEDYSYSRMVLRVTYKTRSGNWQRSQHINVALFP